MQDLAGENQAPPAAVQQQELLIYLSPHARPQLRFFSALDLGGEGFSRLKRDDLRLRILFNADQTLQEVSSNQKRKKQDGDDNALHAARQLAKFTHEVCTFCGCCFV